MSHKRQAEVRVDRARLRAQLTEEADRLYFEAVNRARETGQAPPTPVRYSELIQQAGLGARTKTITPVATPTTQVSTSTTPELQAYLAAQKAGAPVGYTGIPGQIIRKTAEQRVSLAAPILTQPAPNLSTLQGAVYVPPPSI